MQKSQTTLEIFLDQLEKSSLHQQKLTSFITGLFLEKISDISNIEQVSKVNFLVDQLNIGIKQGFITHNQRKAILRRVIQYDYKNVEMFQKEFLEVVQKQFFDISENTWEMEQLHDTKSQQIVKKMLQHDQKELTLRKQKEQQLGLLKALEVEKRELDAKIMQIKEEISRSSNTQCPICLQSIPINDAARLECQHIFHHTCFRKHFQQCVQSRKFPLGCPDCGKQCQQSDIKKYLRPQEYERYDKLLFENFVNSKGDDMSWCPTPGCQYIFFFTRLSSNSLSNRFNCPLCKKSYCLACKTPYHTGISCKQFNIDRVVHDENDTKFIAFAQGAKFKQCPNCNFWVERTAGCNRMVCRCKFSFCYSCGGKSGICACSLEIPLPEYNPPRRTPIFDPPYTSLWFLPEIRKFGETRLLHNSSSARELISLTSGLLRTDNIPTQNKQSKSINPFAKNDTTKTLQTSGQKGYPNPYINIFSSSSGPFSKSQQLKQNIPYYFLSNQQKDNKTYNEILKIANGSQPEKLVDETQKTNLFGEQISKSNSFPSNYTNLFGKPQNKSQASAFK